MALPNGMNGHGGLHLKNRLSESRSPYVSLSLPNFVIDLRTYSSGNGRFGNT